MQDIESTVQEGKLYLLQTRSGKRGAAAAVRVAVDLVRESVIDQHTALLRVPPRELGRLFLPVLDPKDTERAVADGRLLARGLPAAPGEPSDTWSSTPIGRWRPPGTASGSSSFARRRPPRTWPACTPPKALSPRAAGARRTRRSSRSAWESAASSERTTLS